MLLYRKGMVTKMKENTSNIVYLITAEQLGISQEGPGKNLMNNYLHALSQQRSVPKAIMLINTGVRLAVKESEAFEDLKAISDRGCDILSCGMCLNYYGLTESLGVGRISNMQEITGISASAVQTITL